MQNNELVRKRTKDYEWRDQREFYYYLGWDVSYERQDLYA